MATGKTEKSFFLGSRDKLRVLIPLRELSSEGMNVLIFVLGGRGDKSRIKAELPSKRIGGLLIVLPFIFPLTILT